MRFVRLPFAALLGVVLVASGCSSSSSSSPASGSAHTSAAPSSSGRSVAVAPLAQKVVAALQTITSAHLSINGGVLLGSVTGNAQFSHGNATASDLTVTQGGATTRVVTVGATSYAKTGSGSKPWSKLGGAGGKSSAGLAETLSLVRTLGSLNNLAELVALSSAATDKGMTAASHEYAITLDPAKAKGTPFASIMQLAGDTPIPVVLDLDGKNRPTHVQVTFRIGGQSFGVTADISGYNVPVQIAAPPASEVSNP